MIEYDKKRIMEIYESFEEEWSDARKRQLWNFLPWKSSFEDKIDLFKEEGLLTKITLSYTFKDIPISPRLPLDMGSVFSSSIFKSFKLDVLCTLYLIKASHTDENHFLNEIGKCADFFMPADLKFMPANTKNYTMLIETCAQELRNKYEVPVKLDFIKVPSRYDPL